MGRHFDAILRYFSVTNLVDCWGSRGESVGGNESRAWMRKQLAWLDLVVDRARYFEQVGLTLIFCDNLETLSAEGL